MLRDHPDRHPSSMRARATLTTRRGFDYAGRPISKVHVLRSHAALVLRPTQPKDAEPLVRRASQAARVSLVSGAAGPLGGDDFELNICVGEGSTLLFNEISATLLLPGPRGGRSHMRINITVEDDASFVWMAEPLIAAHGCDHIHDVNINLAPSARMLMRDQLLLGRHNEQPGNLLQNLRIRRGGETLFRQQLRLGPRALGWRSPAVIGAYKCVGTVLVVDPRWCEEPPATRLFAPDAALLALEGPAVMISVLAAETLTLGKRMGQGINLLGDPWSPAAARRDAPEGGGATPLQSQDPKLIPVI